MQFVNELVSSFTGKMGTAGLYSATYHLFLSTPFIAGPVIVALLFRLLLLTCSNPRSQYLWMLLGDASVGDKGTSPSPYLLIPLRFLKVH